MRGRMTNISLSEHSKQLASLYFPERFRPKGTKIIGALKEDNIHKSLIQLNGIYYSVYNNMMTKLSEKLQHKLKGLG